MYFDGAYGCLNPLLQRRGPRPTQKPAPPAVVFWWGGEYPSVLSNLLLANRKVRFDFESKAYSFGTCIQTQNVTGYLENVTRPAVSATP